ncbi:AroM family protein [Variovorax rhizosphaerae]|uniref:AroM family protein n=1 Tax=Variovorax rhizosphaerae TaxID=1836200 RepID=A0ABU8WGY4_9BURK
MPRFQLALLTIGQSPRPDMTQAIRDALPAHVAVSERGLLDGMTRVEVEQRFAPLIGSAPLITRLRDGSTVALGAGAVESALQSAIDACELEGADAIVILCTGRFPALRARRAWLVEPDLLVPAVVASLVGEKMLGILAPLQEQIGMVMEKWAELPGRCTADAASPYGPDQALVEAAIRLREQGASALVLDCMGYNAAHKATLERHEIGLPVFVSASVLASALAVPF